MTKRSYIIFSIIPWDFLKQRPQLLASALSENHKVLYIDRSLVSFKDGVRNLDFIKKPGEFFRGSIEKINDNLYIYKLPAFMPNNLMARLEKSARPIFEFIDIFIRTGRIKEITAKYGFGEEIVGIFNLPEQYHLVGSFKSSLSIFDCMDNFTGFVPVEEREYILSCERKMLEKVEAVTATADLLIEKFKYSGKPVFRIPNAVSEDACDFQSVNSEPEDIKNIPSPIAGYIGCISDWFDIDLLDGAVKADPDLNFVLIGPGRFGDLQNERKFEELLKNKNIYYLGPKKHCELPAYLKRFDAGIIPFQVIPLIECCNPVKVYEYFAAGKPVVSTYWKELDHFGGRIGFGSDGSEFSAKIREAILENSASKIRERTEFAADNTWKQRAEDFDKIKATKKSENK
jgi:glycosyltransferase involved in cell wall biosynthesis